jgi:hypothetical protein
VCGKVFFIKKTKNGRKSNIKEQTVHGFGRPVLFFMRQNYQKQKPAAFPCVLTIIMPQAATGRPAR